MGQLLLTSLLKGSYVEGDSDLGSTELHGPTDLLGSVGINVGLNSGGIPFGRHLDSETRLRAIFNGTFEFIGLLSPEGIVLDANKTAMDWISAKREDVIGRHVWTTPWWTGTPGGSEIAQKAIHKAALGDFVRHEIELLNPAGEKVTFNFSLTPVFDESGKVVLIVSEGRDISERKRGEEELKRRLTDNQKLSEINKTLVGIFDFEQIANVICRAARELSGADGSTFVLREGNRVRYSAEDSISPLWKGLDFPVECCISGWSILNNEPAIIEDIYLDPRIPHEAYRPTFVKSLVMTPVGASVPVAAIGAYWKEKYKADSYVVGLLQSLASAANLALGGVRGYEGTRLAWSQAEEAVRLKDEFLATLSHELRNPLNSIVGYSEVLQRSEEAKKSPRIARAASVIQRNAKIQAQLINDLLDLSRLSTGKLRVDRRPLFVNSLVADSVDSMRQEAEIKGVTINTCYSPELIQVNGDPIRLQQIVWNLLTNAVKFTPRGGSIHVELSRRENSAELLVSDTGEGIEPEFLPCIFEMFQQADARTTRRHGGMGIGLAIVRQLVGLHDGTARASSDGKGRGARFTVTLPLHNTEILDRNPPAKMSLHKLSGIRILAIDDSVDSLAMLEALLTAEGALVQTAADAAQALKHAEDSCFDLVISDISMPEMDGYEFLHRLRQDIPRYRSVPAIALTGFGREEDEDRAIDAGYCSRLIKPLDFEQLLEAAHSNLNR